MIASLTLLAYVLAATGVLLISTGLLLRWRWRRLDAAELERRRRLRVNRIGRLADGRIVELVEASEGGRTPRGSRWLSTTTKFAGSNTSRRRTSASLGRGSTFGGWPAGSPPASSTTRRIPPTPSS
ncbi:hypothetical protein MYX77_13100, partial [Acidobacteriia bacterium AH_259_A11_L15]|nr:hypothetical protein [Acidobacteriia bacterium AH_259_A11_L15]